MKKVSECIGGGGGKSSAFTLAEVLITLGIIGIVAALTIPTLVQTYKKKLISTEIKKFYSLMNNAIQLSEIDNGFAFTWNKAPIAYDEDGNIDNESQRNRIKKFFNSYIEPYLKVVEVEDEDEDNTIRVHLADGSVLRMYNGACIDIMLLTDPKEKKLLVGRNCFRFLLCTSKESSEIYHKGTPNKAFASYQDFDVSTREKCLEECRKSGNCTPLLELYDNFEFKDDYPYKL